MNILFLATWYPNRYDEMDGLFVRKHAQAVARQEGNSVDVIYICCRDEVTHNELTEVTIDGVRELTLYHPPFNGAKEGFDAVRNIWHEWRKRHGMLPDVVHLNVISAKLGLIARYLKCRHHIPYVITEHWSGYLPENGNFKGCGQVLSARWLARGASAIMPVSDRLMSAMKGHKLKCRHWQVVNNVVDDFFYSAVEKEPHSHFRFLHVSCFDDKPKNVMGIVDAIAILASLRSDFELMMVGSGPDWQRCVDSATQKGLISSGIVTFVGLCTPQQVKEQMEAADCFLLFSNYENAPVVLSESLAVGLPIVSTPAGTAMEIVTERVGELVPFCDTQALAAAMSRMIDNHLQYSPDYIRSLSHSYSFDAVGRQYTDIYRKALGW